MIGGLAAICGGFVASMIDKCEKKTGPKILVGFIVVVGVLVAVAQMSATPKPLPEGTKIADLGFVEAGQYATSPTWYNWLIPLIGAAGAWGGANIRTSQAGPKPQANDAAE